MSTEAERREVSSISGEGLAEGRTPGDAESAGPAADRTGATQEGTSMSEKDSGSTAGRGVGTGAGTGGAVISEGLGYEGGGAGEGAGGGAGGSLVGISRGGTGNLGVGLAPAVTFQMLAPL